MTNSDFEGGEQMAPSPLSWYVVRLTKSQNSVKSTLSVVGFDKKGLLYHQPTPPTPAGTVPRSGDVTRQCEQAFDSHYKSLLVGLLERSSAVIAVFL